MAKQRYIDTKFWDDDYITSLNPHEKLLFLYFLTNPLTNIAGIYEITRKRIAFDTGLPEKEIESILKKFADTNKIHYLYGWIVISNFPKYQNYQNSPKIKQGIELIFKQLPQFVLDEIDRSSIPYLYPSNYLNTNTNTNTNGGIHIDDSLKEAKEFLGHYFKEYKKLIGDNLPVHSERIILPEITAKAESYGGYEKLKELLHLYFTESDSTFNGKLFRDNKWTLTCFLSEKILNRLNG